SGWLQECTGRLHCIHGTPELRRLLPCGATDQSSDSGFDSVVTAAGGTGRSYHVVRAPRGDVRHSACHAGGLQPSCKVDSQVKDVVADARVFRPKVKLLTEEEYILQGDVETRKALNSLREFCGSPNCKTWQVVTRLKDPVRFAKFVQGQSHLADEEVLQYELDSSDRPPSDEDYQLTEESDNEQPSFTELAE
ncbi:hypothetical protein MTO96_033174, partial [Rhipicephalus appendiculatus]